MRLAWSSSHTVAALPWPIGTAKWVILWVKLKAWTLAGSDWVGPMTIYDQLLASVVLWTIMNQAFDHDFCAKSYSAKELCKGGTLKFHIVHLHQDVLPTGCSSLSALSYSLLAHVFPMAVEQILNLIIWLVKWTLYGIPNVLCTVYTTTEWIVYCISNENWITRSNQNNDLATKPHHDQGLLMVFPGIHLTSKHLLKHARAIQTKRSIRTIPDLGLWKLGIPWYNPIIVMGRCNLNDHDF